eukprot:CAMPEP_0182539040 /NCGR_PEP_ID=MMETSP1323-20130603/24704_1 /TAXON_ID=236787 /ORGANISM="Florenciella parvula, Strain RCC1693" /LENGTH=96 /DNA_ID=CAMNT_0024749561 /DNA_START=8 /DNA_END=298 /DNA_ORIENTATION=+
MPMPMPYPSSPCCCPVLMAAICICISSNAAPSLVDLHSSWNDSSTQRRTSEKLATRTDDWSGADKTTFSSWLLSTLFNPFTIWPASTTASPFSSTW